MDIMRHFQSKEEYRELLKRFYGLYQPLERKLADSADWETEGLDFGRREKTPWLEQDLRVLGLADDDIAGLPRCENLPLLSGLASAAGCLYVLEGATLGGQVISRFLSQQLGVSPVTGGQFFSGYGVETGSRWKAFGIWAESACGGDAVCEETAGQAAEDTFDSFIRWFQ